MIAALDEMVESTIWPADVMEELEAGRYAQAVMQALEGRTPDLYHEVQREQDEIARGNQERFWTGNGPVKQMAVHPRAYHYWGRRLGYACWSDPQFCREFQRDNPNVRVRSRSSRVGVGPSGSGAKDVVLAGGTTPRFRKVYPS